MRAKRRRGGIGLALAVVLVGSAGLAACGGDAGGEAVNVYSHRHYAADRQLFERFEEETGIRVNVVTASADELITRLENEGAGSPADLLVTVDAGRLHRAKTRGLLQPVESEVLAANVPANLRDDEGQWYGLTTRARVLMYAPDRADPTELRTYGALADERWAGRVLSRSSSNVYSQSLLASLIAHEGEAAAAEWAESVADNLAREPSGGDTDQIKAVAAGVGDVAIAVERRLIFIRAVLGGGSDGDSGIQVVEMEGMIEAGLTHVFHGETLPPSLQRVFNECGKGITCGGDGTGCG